MSTAEISTAEKGSFEDADVRVRFEGKLRQREITDEYNQAILEHFELSSGNGKINVLSKDATYNFNWENFDKKNMVLME